MTENLTSTDVNHQLQSQRTSFVSMCNYLLLDVNRKISTLQELINTVNLFHLLKVLCEDNGREFPFYMYRENYHPKKRKKKKKYREKTHTSNVETCMEYLRSFENFADLEDPKFSLKSLTNRDENAMTELVWKIFFHFRIHPDFLEFSRSSEPESSTFPIDSTCDMVEKYVRKLIKWDNRSPPKEKLSWSNGEVLFRVITRVYHGLEGATARKYIFGRDEICRMLETVFCEMKVPRIVSADDFIHNRRESIALFISFVKRWSEGVHVDRSLMRCDMPRDVLLRVLRDVRKQYGKECRVRNEIARHYDGQKTALESSVKHNKYLENMLKEKEMNEERLMNKQKALLLLMKNKTQDNEMEMDRVRNELKEMMTRNNNIEQVVRQSNDTIQKMQMEHALKENEIPDKDGLALLNDIRERDETIERMKAEIIKQSKKLERMVALELEMKNMRSTMTELENFRKLDEQNHSNEIEKLKLKLKKDVMKVKRESGKKWKKKMVGAKEVNTQKETELRDREKELVARIEKVRISEREKTKEIQKREQTIKKLKLELESSKLENRTAQKKDDEKINLSEQNQKKIQKLSGIIKQKEMKIKEYQLLHQNSHQNVQQLSDLVKQKEMKIKEYEILHQNSHQNNEAVSKNFLESRLKVEQLKNELKMLKEKLSDVEVKYQIAEKYRKEQEGKLEKLRNVQNSNNETLKNQVEIIQNLQKTNAELKKRHSDTRREMEEKDSDHFKQIEELVAENEQKCTDFSKKTQKMNMSFNKERENWKNLIKKMSEERTVLSTEVKSLEEKMSQKDETIKSKSKDIREMRVMTEKRRKSLDKLKKMMEKNQQKTENRAKKIVSSVVDTISKEHIKQLQIIDQAIAKLSQRLVKVTELSKGQRGLFSVKLESMKYRNKLEEAKSQVGKLRFGDISEVHSYYRPKPIVFLVVKAVLLTLGSYGDESDLLKWTDCKKHLKTRLLKDILDYQPTEKTDIGAIRGLINDSNETDAQKCSKAVASIYFFLKSVEDVVKQLSAEASGRQDLFKSVEIEDPLTPKEQRTMQRKRMPVVMTRSRSTPKTRKESTGIAPKNSTKKKKKRRSPKSRLKKKRKSGRY